MLTPKRDPFSSISSNTPVNRGMLSENQYNWSVGQGNKIDLGNGQYGDLRNALDRPDNPIKDVFNEEGVRIGAYNTQTGYRYGLQNTNRESTGTESIAKNQNNIVNSQSPDSSVNQTVNSAMSNSLLTSPDIPNYITPIEVEKLNNSSKLANDNNPLYEGVYNIAKGFGNVTSGIRNWNPF